MKKNQWIQLLFVTLIVVMSVAFTGCASNNEESNKTTENQAGQENVEQTKSKVKSTTLMAEGKLTQIFEADEASGKMIAKSRYQTLDDVKKFYSAYYTEPMAQKVVDSYVKMEKVGDTEVPVLTLPEDYVKLDGQTPEIKVENDKATLSFTESGKTVTYGLVKQNDQWLVDSKEVK